MKQLATFSGWDFTNIWRIDEGVSYPTLRVFWTPPPPSTNNTWLGLLDNFYTTVGNWSLGHVPIATETVLIPDVAGTAFIQMADGTFTVKSITSAELFNITGFDTSFTLTNSGSFNAGLRLGAGATLNAQGMLSLSSYTLGAGAKINITQSGTGILTIGGLPYTVINSLGAAGSATALDLQGMNGGLSTRYALGSNIDASATSTWNAGAGFAPVGDATTKFTGIFDGLGHTVTGLTINRPSTDFVGLFGYTTDSTIRNVGLVGGNISGAMSVGGLVGYNNNGTISNSYNTGNISGTGAFANVGGLAGGSSGTIGNSYNTGSVSGTYGVGGLVGDQYGTITNSYNTGNVSGTGEFSSVGGLAGSSWAGATISNSYNAGGVSGDRDVGGLTGNSRGSISSSYNTGIVRGNVGVGGLAGSSRGDISNAYNTGEVSGNDGVGGLAGASEGNISNSYNTGSVTGNDSVGGLAGSSLSDINNSYNTGSVIGRNGVGGLVGSSASNINNSYNTGSVFGTGNSIGGLVASNGGSISNSYNTGSVSSAGDDVGGLVGENWDTVTNSYNIASVSGKNYVGGLVGYNNSTGAIRDSYNVGSVTGANYFVGGLVGYNYFITGTSIDAPPIIYAEISNSFWNTQTSGQTTSFGGGTGLTTAQMKQQTSFTGWDFSTAWNIDEGASFPYLRTNAQNPHPTALTFMSMSLTGATASAIQAIATVIQQTALTSAPSAFIATTESPNADSQIAASDTTTASDASTGSWFLTVTVAGTTLQKPADEVVRLAQPKGSMLTCRRTSL